MMESITYQLERKNLVEVQSKMRVTKQRLDKQLERKPIRQESIVNVGVFIKRIQSAEHASKLAQSIDMQRTQVASLFWGSFTFTLVPRLHMGKSLNGYILMLFVWHCAQFIITTSSTH